MCLYYLINTVYIYIYICVCVCVCVYRRSARILRRVLETRCHSNSSENSSAKVGVKTSQSSKIIPQSLIVECLKVYYISDNVIKLIMEVMKNWKGELTEGGKIFAQGKI